MGLLRSAAHLLPAPLRRSVVAGIDAAVPLRWQLPYTVRKLRLQGALDEEIGLLPQLVARERGAIDAGANIGIYSYFLSGLCPQVEAFEPNPACLRVLQAWAGGRVSAHAVALSDATGEAILRVPVHGGEAQTGLASLQPAADAPGMALRVPTRRLDDYGFSRIGFLKVDVEGHELDAFDERHHQADFLAGRQRRKYVHNFIFLPPWHPMFR